jgi:hypothetical protein
MNEDYASKKQIRSDTAEFNQDPVEQLYIIRAKRASV